MAIDSANVWNSTNPWAIPNTNALVSGLSYASQTNPAASVADPTSTPTTSNPTSASRMLGTAVPDTSAVPRGGTLAQSTQFRTQTLPMSALSAGLSKLTVSQGAPTVVAPNATSNTQAQSANIAAPPPAVVAVPSGTGGGDYTYFTYSQAAGGYVQAGTYNTQTKQGYTDSNAATQAAMQLTQATQAMQVAAQDQVHGGILSDAYKTASAQAVAARAKLDSLKFDPSVVGSNITYSGTPLTKNSPSSSVDQVNQQYSQQIDTYRAGQQTAVANQQATAQSQEVAQAVAYMTSHGGQMNPGVVLPAAAVTAAQDAYASQQAANGSLFQINGASGAAPINTDTADIAGVAAQNAITSQYSTNLGGADAGQLGRAAAFAHSAQSGENQLTHDTAAATSFNNNLAAFGNALTAQATADTNATGAKLNTDIQNVSDMAAQLEQQISTLDATTQAAVKGQLDNLNQQIAYYNQQVQQYGSDVGFVMNIAKGVLAAGAAVAAVATGGVAGVAIAGAAAASAAATK